MNVWASVWAPSGFLRARRNLLLAHKMQTGGKFKFRQPSESPPRPRRQPPLAVLSYLTFDSLLLPLSIQKPEAALVSRRNQPRADNNEIHKSVREHAEHTPLHRVQVPLSLPSSFISLSLSLSASRFLLQHSGSSEFTRVATFPCSANLRLRRVTLDRVLLRVETSLRFFASAARPGYIVYASQVRSDALRITSLELVCNRERLAERNYLVS